ncbi:MAG: ChbG/HpnK family deacetylase [Planctomycetes bacterium]|nr:ChbG/HpnK family deacetylase [Planctomycetota bacterium]
MGEAKWRTVLHVQPPLHSADIARHGDFTCDLLRGLSMLRRAVRTVLLIALCCVFLGEAAAAELGGESDIRLIVRADDIGSSHAANVGCIESYRNGIVRSVEVMVPCAWFEEAVRMLNENPGLDVGVHLTLTSEWDRCKWRPLTPGPSLVNANGYFYQMTRQGKQWPAGTGFLEANPKTEEVEAELRAQIELAVRRIKNVSHLSAHMGTAVCRPDLSALVDKLAKEYNLHVDLKAHNVQHVRGMGDGKLPPETRPDALAETLESLTPGLWLLVEHPARDTPEMRAIGHKGYEHVANDREGVTRAFTSEKVKEVVQRKNIRLMSYGDFK